MAEEEKKEEKKNALAMMMGSAARKKKWHPQPAGRPRAGHKWDHYAGDWTPIESDALPEGGGADDNNDDDDGDDDETVVAGTAKRRSKHRTFQSAWKNILPTLIVVSMLASGAVCPSDDGANCGGCNWCSAMFCGECQLAGTENTFTKGCKNFHMGACRGHMSIWHPPRVGGDIAEGIAKTIDEHADKVKGIMANVLWLGKESVALRKITTFCQLPKLQGVPLGQHYIHDHAARDFVMAIAYVLRQRIIMAARVSPCLGLMVDESTDVSKHGSSVMYLRLLMNGVFVTVFWRILQVSDASGDGLFSLISSAFEMDGIPKWLLFSFASDGASVMTGSENRVAVQLRAAFSMFMLLCHCIAHRHALACASAAKDNEVCSFFEISARRDNWLPQL